MSSILKVDTLQDTGGNTILSSDGSGTFTSNLGGGITEVDVWMVTADMSDGTNADITTNLARASTQVGNGLGYLGTGMTESSGIFSFPSTGIWRVDVNLQANVAAGDNAALRVNVTTDNSTYNGLVFANVSNKAASGTQADIDTGNVSAILDVTDTSNVKVKFTTTGFGSGTSIQGSTAHLQTYFMFTRLGDT